MTILQDILAALNWQVRVNENFSAVSPAALFSKKHSTTTGLTLGYYGGILDGVSYADGTHLLTASTTRYVVAARATGVVSSSTGTTNWNDQVNYLRMGIAVVGASTITTWTDWRQAYGGSGGGSSSVAGADKQVQYNASGAFGAEAGFEYDYTSNTLAVPNATFTGLALTAASSTGGAGLRVPHGAAPTAPTNGDVWTTTAGMYARINGATVGPFGAGGGMSNPLTTTGDIIYSSSGTTAARLGIGSANQILTVVGGVPTWQNAASGFTNPMTTAGDIITGGSGGAAQRLAAGTNGYVLTMVSGSPAWAAAAGGGGLTNFTEGVSTATPNATIPVVSLTATNAAAGVDVALVPKGVGGILAQVPNNATSGGGKRGNNSVDLQSSRAAVAQVASGHLAVIAGGSNNTASGNFGVVAGGTNNTASNYAATVCGGDSNTANNQYAVVCGGQSNTASGQHSAVTNGSGNTAAGQHSFIGGGNSNSVTGSPATNAAIVGGTGNTATGSGSFIGGSAAAIDRGLTYSVVHSAGRFAADGDAQSVRFVHRRATTDATPTALSSNGSAPAATTVLVMPNASAYTFVARVVARANASGDCATFEVKGAIKRGANAAATAIVGTVTATSLGADAGASAWAATAVADTTLGALTIQVTGAAATTIKWVASIWTTEVVG